MRRDERERAPRRAIFGVTGNRSGRRATTWASARRFSQNEARWYCSLRQVGTPHVPTMSARRLATRNGTMWAENSPSNDRTGAAPAKKNTSGARRSGTVQSGARYA